MDNEAHFFALEIFPLIGKLKKVEVEFKAICDQYGLDAKKLMERITHCRGCDSYQLIVKGVDQERFCSECSASHGWESGGFNRYAQIPSKKTLEQVVRGKVAHQRRELSKKYPDILLSEIDWPSFVVFVNQRFSLYAKHVIILTLEERGEPIPEELRGQPRPNKGKMDSWAAFCDEFRHQPNLQLVGDVFVNPLYKEKEQK